MNKLTNEQIEQYAKSPFGAVAALAKELKKTRKELEKQSEYIKELERDAERGESGVNGVV